MTSSRADGLVSIIVPFFNERATLPRVVARVLAAPLPAGFRRELILVDDGSTDGSAEAAATALRGDTGGRLLRLERNHGKGTAVRAGLDAARGELVLVQDADLEYDPDDYPALLAPFADPRVDAVYGSRILGSPNRSYDRYYWGGRVVSLFTTILFGQRITDEPTGYKVVRRELVPELRLAARGFEFCPEITAKLLRSGRRIVEVPIRYAPRSFAEGKKIRARDGAIALWTLLRLRLGLDRRDRPATPPVWREES